ncbi:MAG: class I SAM-dependent methyltransferase [Candidatus Levyibacteriota bacterium]|nr:MAG: class I SAM-dependent methyltransferase [Candidatus Levybacteria bacterium]
MYKNRQEFLKKRYDPVANRTINYENDPRLKAILSFLVKRNSNAKDSVKLLDIGCYDGYLASLLKDCLRNCEAYGIDIAKKTIVLARQKGIIAKICDIEKGIDFESNFFDYVFAGEIIEHLYDTDFFLREIKRILKPDGTLIITTPNFVSFGRRLYYLFGKGAFMEQSFSLPKNAAGHIRYFTFETLKELLQLHKFEQITAFSDTITLPGFFLFDAPAKIFPTLGRSIISFSRNKKDKKG